MKLFRTRITVSGVSAYRAADKLARAGIALYRVRRGEKNTVSFEVGRSDLKKTFAILQGSCYNVEKTEERGLSRASAWAKRSAGFLVGAALFLAVVLAAQTRVLRIDVVGSGAYYRTEVVRILNERGAGLFGVYSEESGAVAQILALPRVHFCTVKSDGGVLTVEVEVGDENAPLTGEPLLSPAEGIVEELVVVRGTAEVAVGDSVAFGQTAVGNYVVSDGERRGVVVIARIAVRCSFAGEYEGSEEEVRSRVYLEYGETELHMEKTERGYRVEGSYLARAAINLG